ncbi:S8 family serine peptidase [Scytonema sp. NUACC26]|uniref:S8 family serine peptidase n=1 Tax=Scytonema sp. NUACC26 TaxID=3140176 RepID=UPI0034DBA3FB
MTGKVTSVGDRAIRSDIARQLFHVDGTGIKIGIISTSFNALSGLEADVKSGDLPGEGNPYGKTASVTLLKDLANTSPSADDEGRAMAQIIHDIAPGAEIFFHTIFEDEGQTASKVNEDGFAKAVSALMAEGVDIIVDDTPVPAPFFQDGVVAKAVQNATDNGITFISAAGNNGNLAYESKFRPGNTFSLGDLTFVAHDFDPGEGIDLFQNIEVTEDGTIIRPLLSWDEPIGNNVSEYDMFLLNSPELPSESNVLSISTIPSLSALDEPLKILFYQPEKDETLYLTIARRGTDSHESSTIKWISSANGLDRATTYEYVDPNLLNRTVYGQANAPTSIAVGASESENPQDVRTYTSRGGSPILLDTEGTRLSLPVLREKPEVFAPDAVETTFSSDTSFNPFSGTSASAPHVAGVVALMLERAGGSLSSESVSSVLQATSLPITQEAGFVQADRAIIESFVSTYTGTEGNDILQGNSSADNLYGKEGDDVLIGNEGRDYLAGGSGADVLVGGMDSDVLIGGSGRNVVLGGEGKDTFVLEPNAFSLIADFELGRDLLAFSGVENAQNLMFLQQGSDTLIEYSGDIIAKVLGVETPDNITITMDVMHYVI